MNKEHYYTSQTDRERLSSSQRQLMSLQSKYDTLLLKEREHLNNITDLHKVLDNQIWNFPGEQTPMYMLNTLEECYNYLMVSPDVIDSEGLLKDLRNVIKFLQQ